MKSSAAAEGGTGAGQKRKAECLGMAAPVAASVGEGGSLPKRKASDASLEVDQGMVSAVSGKAPIEAKEARGGLVKIADAQDAQDAQDERVSAAEKQLAWMLR